MEGKLAKRRFPTLYSMALDYIPIQATSVPCERVFSSAGETDTKRRNRIHPTLMEALQLLKFSLKWQRLDFTAGLQTPQDEMVLPTDDEDDHLGRLSQRQGGIDDELLRIVAHDD